MIRAYTGPSNISLPAQAWVQEVLRDLTPTAAEERSGAAFGVDTLVAEWFAPSGDLHLFVPGAYHNEDLVASLQVPEVKTTRCPAMASLSATYRKRNAMMLDGADVLVAFLKANSFYRSGEWMTVNIAGDAGIEVLRFIIPAF